MKRPHVRRILALAATVVSVLLALSVRYTSATSAQTENGEGGGWLSWNSDTRLGFVWGYTMGLSRGFGEGCGAYYRVPPAGEPYSLRDDPFGKCIGKGFGFSQPPTFYEKQITDFYTSFAEDRDVPLNQVFKRLSDSENLTLQQTHERAKEHGHAKWVNSH
jgi:hypothetical protein